MPICYNKDKSGNPLKIKEKRTCPCSFSNHIPGKIRPQRPWTERGCFIKDKAKFTKSRARTCKHRKQNTAVQRNCRSSAPAQVNRPPTQWTASTPQDQYTLFQGNTQEKSCGWTAPSCVSFRHRVGPYTCTVFCFPTSERSDTVKRTYEKDLRGQYLLDDLEALTMNGDAYV